jgi:hypothetical protein
MNVGKQKEEKSFHFCFSPTCNSENNARLLACCCLLDERAKRERENINLTEIEKIIHVYPTQLTGAERHQ